MLICVRKMETAKNFLRGWHGSTARQAIAYYTSTPDWSVGLILAISLLIQLLANTSTGKADDGPAAGDPSPMEETRMELLAPASGLAQLWQLWSFGE